MAYSGPDYITQLHERQREIDPMGGAIIGLGSLAGSLLTAQNEQQDRSLAIQKRLRELAGQTLAGTQQAVQAASQAGQYEKAVGLANFIPKQYDAAYGTDTASTFKPLVGGTKQVPDPAAPQPQGPTPMGAPLAGPMKSVPDFENPQTKIGLAALMPPTAVQQYTPGATLGRPDPLTGVPSLMGQIPYTAKPMTEYERQSLDVKRENVNATKEQAGAKARTHTADEYNRQHLAWSTSLANHVQQAVTSFVSTNTRTVKDITGAEHVVRPGLMEIEAARKTAEQEYRRMNAEPTPPGDGANPSGGGGATPAGKPPAGTAPKGKAALGPLVESAARKYGVDPALVGAILDKESGWNMGSRGKAGEVGAMQIMPDMHGPSAKALEDPTTNIETGVRLLAGLLAQYHDLHTAVSHYNGSGPAARAYADSILKVYQGTGRYPKAGAPARQSAAPGQGGDRLAAFYARHGITPGAADA